MARQNGILKVTGKLDDLSFYKSKEGYLVRTKGGVPKERIQNDPAFVRTRENGAEFGQSAYAGKLLRVAVRNMLLNAGDSRVTSRLTQVMSKVKNYDVTSARGDRKVSIGLTDDAAKALLKGFNFNKVGGGPGAEKSPPPPPPPPIAPCSNPGLATIFFLITG